MEAGVLFRGELQAFLPSPLAPSLRVSYSVWTGGNLGTSVGQLSEEEEGVGGLRALKVGTNHPVLFQRPPTI